MRVLGLLAGAGSLLWEARDLGCDVVGNVDPRPYFKRAPWVWPLNFPEAPFFPTFEEVKESRPRGWFDVELAIGHPPCGSFSHLGRSGARLERFANEEERQAWHDERESNRGLLPLFVSMVQKFKPKTFTFDNLPRMLRTISESEWNELLPHYKLTFIDMVNWDYGSCQKRRRLWVVGTRHRKPFRFVPVTSRLDGPKDAYEAIYDLPWQPWIDLPELEHVHHHPDSKPIGGYWARSHEDEHIALQDFIRYSYGFMTIPTGLLWPYKTRAGRYTRKPSRARLVMERPCRTLSGNETLNHPLTGWPLTIRERARVMGWPDAFKLAPEGMTLDRTTITKLVMVTGRAVPSEFPRFLIPQLLDHANGF